MCQRRSRCSHSPGFTCETRVKVSFSAPLSTRMICMQIYIQIYRCCQEKSGISARPACMYTAVPLPPRVGLVLTLPNSRHLGSLRPPFPCFTLSGRPPVIGNTLIARKLFPKRCDRGLFRKASPKDSAAGTILRESGLQRHSGRIQTFNSFSP